MSMSRTQTLEPLLAPLPSTARELLLELLHARMIDEEPLTHFLQDRREWLPEYTTAKLLQGLFRYNLLTGFQRERVLSGEWRSLLPGNYRILDIVASGGMGTVYRGEHCLLKRKIALKVVPLDDDLHPAIRQRFYAEMRALAELNHPNIVAALDAGEVPPRDGEPGAIYLVLELVTGGDLDQYVRLNGPCPIGQACSFIRQAATGLHVAHDRHLIHRDVKPSNLLLTEEGQIKLVDFGLARHFSSRLTDPRALLGSLDFMPPEQSIDPSSVGKEADIFGLGATLFWLLTGEPIYPPEPNLSQALLRLQQQPPRRVSELRPEVPPALDDLVARMLDRDPARRPYPPLLVMHALTPFVFRDTEDAGGWSPSPGSEGNLSLENAGPSRPARLLLLEEDSVVRLIARLRDREWQVRDTDSPEFAISLLRREPPALVVIHLDRPDAILEELCQQLRTRSTVGLLKIIVVASGGEIAGADEQLVPTEAVRLLPARISMLLQLKEAQERSMLLTAQNTLTAHRLQESLQARARDVREAHNALLFAMAKMAESREGETAGHLKRLQNYSRALASAAATMPPWNALVDARFLELLDRCLPLHDIGKIGLPEDVLMKPGSLNAQERALVETHPVIGDRILAALAREHGTSLEFLGTARALVRHHHERYDGTGYPDRLVGEAIPAVARLTAVADVYDALRRDRLHKRAQSHDEAVRIILNRSAGQFDPHLLQAFSRCHPRFEEIFQELDD